MARRQPLIEPFADHYQADKDQKSDFGLFVARQKGKYALHLLQPKSVDSLAGKDCGWFWPGSGDFMPVSGLAVYQPEQFSGQSGLFTGS